MSTNNLSKNSSLISEKKNLNWREKVLNDLLRGTFFFAVLAAFFATTNLINDSGISQQLKLTLSSIYIGATVLLGIITFIPRFPYMLRASVLFFLYYGLALTGLIESGLSGDGRIFVFAFIIIAAILFDMRFGLLALGLGIITLVIIAFLFTKGIIYIPLERLANSTSLSSWTSGTLVLTLLVVSIIIPVTYLIRNFETQIKKTNELLQDAERKRGTLQEQVIERTSALEYRAKQLEIASQVAHNALVFQNVDELLSNITRLISERFGYYHAGVFLLDDREEYAVLQAASSVGGQKMLTRGHQLRVGSEGIVGSTAAEKRPHIALDVGTDAIFFNNPDLPETHSEMAIPLLAQNNVIGVLDIQSTEIKAFSQQDIEIFQTLANQIALAIQNAQLIEASQENISQLERLAGVQSQQIWETHLEDQIYRFRYTPLGIKRLKKHVEFDTEDKEYTNVPIQIQGKEIGKITLRRISKKWSDKEKSLIAEITDQVGLALENTRLVNETREQASRDQLVSEFSTKLRETLDMDTVLKTAINEMKKTFNLKEVEVRLNLIDEDEIEI